MIFLCTVLGLYIIIDNNSFIPNTNIENLIFSFNQRIILQSTVYNSQALFFVRYALTIIYHALLPPSVSERELPTCLEVQGGWKLLLHVPHVHIQWNPVSLIDLYLVEILAIWACSIFVAFSQHGEWSHSYYRTTIKQ